MARGVGCLSVSRGAGRPGSGRRQPRWGAWPAALPHIQAARGAGVLGVRKPRARNGAAARYRPRATSWPRPAQARISLTGSLPPLTAAGQAQRLLVSPGIQARGAGTPLWAQPAGRAGSAPVTGVAVRVLGHSEALAAGVHGVVFTARPAPGSAAGRVRLGISYATFGQASGGNYGLSLGLVELPACALSTPQRAACRTGHPLASVNDPAAQTVSAPVTLPAAGSGVVLAAAATYSDGGGPAGTYNATSLRPSGTWSAGGSAGSFTYSYPLSVPPAASTLVPQLAPGLRLRHRRRADRVHPGAGVLDRGRVDAGRAQHVHRAVVHPLRRQPGGQRGAGRDPG